MPTKTESIALFLKHFARPELAKLYSLDMECQINAAQDGGELEQGVTAAGKHWQAWRNPEDPTEPTWKSFRIPFNANTEANYVDSKINWDLAKHCEGVGLTGWDWRNRVSRWLAYDFDAIVGHSDKHQQKLSDDALLEVQNTACQIPWVTVRKSTSGNGLHLYVFVNAIPTNNHTEHAALGRAILGKMSAMTGFDFNAAVDNVGGNMWVWHRKFNKAGGVNGPGLKTIKEGIPLVEIPLNWKDHIKVTKGASKRCTPGFVGTKEVDWFEDICGQQTKVPLDTEHKALIAFLEEGGALYWWDADHHMIVCHTADLKAAHDKLGLRGIFDTNASGANHGSDQNCFAFPTRRGGWVVRRHTQGVQEHESWDQDLAGWTRTYLNTLPDIKMSSKSFGGIEDGERSTFQFQEAGQAAKAVQALGVTIALPAKTEYRGAVIKPMKDGKMIFKIKKEDKDNFQTEGWFEAKDGYWHKTLKTPASAQSAADSIGNYDDVVRHMINEIDADAGWAVKANNWVQEPLKHVQLALAGMMIPAKDGAAILGGCILRSWKLVSRPFQPEYPGDRLWNKNAAQLAFAPNPDLDNLKYDTWTDLLNHCGRGLDDAILRHDWCRQNGIRNGGDYLKMWVASMFQKPLEPLPYLFLYGDQGTGKSTLPEALKLLMTRGVQKADRALTNPQGFNGELQGAVMCTIEETDLSQNKSLAYNRIKDWSTSPEISIHFKGVTPYTARNSTHWIHTANEPEYCPVFVGDTRITMIKVDFLRDRTKYMPKTELFVLLQKEAPDFIAALLDLEIPKSKDRLNLPIIETEEKKQAQSLNQNELEAFLQENCFEIPGEMVTVAEFFDRFQEWLDESRRHVWTKPKTMKHLPVTFPRGRNMKDQAKWYIGNISWYPSEPDAQPKPRLFVENEKLCIEGRP